VGTRSFDSVQTAAPSSDTSTSVASPARTVPERAARLHQRPSLLGQHVRQPAPRPVRDGVEAALVGVGSLESLAGADRVDAARVHPPYVGRVEAQLGARRRQEIRDVDVGPRDQPVERVPARVRAQVERDAALVAVELFEQEIEIAGVGDEPHRHDLSQRVAGRPFHLDDVGTPLGENRGSRRHEPVLGNLDHLDSVQHAHRVHLPVNRFTRRHRSAGGRTSPCRRARP
jgi:hypothetical protein